MLELNMIKCIINKSLAVAVILLFLSVGFQPAIANENVKKSLIPISSGNTLYVGGSGEGNYTSIQDAIDNASDGDTVFVYKGIYYEHVKIVKDINLFGEDMEKTIIDAGGIETAVEIGANVNLSGFTIRNAEEGISNFIPPPPDNVYKFYVYGNIISNNIVGFALGGTLNNIIYDNIIKNNQIGINFFYADNYEVNNNNFIDNEKHAYFEYILFLQFMPRIKWKGNHWDDWDLRIPKSIRGEKVIVFVLRPGWITKATVCSWWNIDWYPAKEPYDIEV
jgi:parallel beta-helix repeat protein